jgi:hypothetical protein
VGLDFPDWTNPIIPGKFVLTGTGVTKVAVTGTRVALRASTAMKQVFVRARVTNVGTLYLGGATVTNSETALTGGLQLAPGDLIAFPELNLANIFIVGLAGDGVSYVWFA